MSGSARLKRVKSELDCAHLKTLGMRVGVFCPRATVQNVIGGAPRGDSHMWRRDQTAGLSLRDPSVAMVRTEFLPLATIWFRWRAGRSSTGFDNYFLQDGRRAVRKYLL